MSDVLSDTTGFLNSNDFDGASVDDLRLIAAQVLIYADEVCAEHDDKSSDGMVKKIVQYLHDEEQVDDDSSYACHFTFEYYGEEWIVMTSDLYDERYDEAKEQIVDHVQDEFQHAITGISTPLEPYIQIDTVGLVRDMEYGDEINMWLASYDGHVHEMSWAEYSLNNKTDVVTNRGYLYAFREN